jgi:phospholipid/cholesterol/gamma-HCH transport system substrate-binding protein
MGRHGVAETVTGACVLLVAVAFLAYAVAHSGRTSGSGYSLIARFEHIDGLAVGSDVRIAGVKVGTVTDAQIDPKTFLAVVSLTVQNDVQLPKDSAAAITSESLLGGKYISLSPGGDETDLKPGQTITITQSSVSLEELLGKFIFSVTSLNSSKAAQQSGSSGQSGTNPPGSGQPASGPSPTTPSEEPK